MKKFSIFLLASLFIPILDTDYEYDLIYNTEMTINSLTENNYYYCYYPSNIYKEADISITVKNDTLLPFSTLNILEYYNETTKKSHNYRNKYIVVIDFSMKNDEYITTFSQLTNYLINYMGIRIYPNRKIDYLKIKITIPNCFESVNGVAKTINSLKYPREFYFFISSSLFQTISINITLDKEYQRPFYSLDIYEFEDRYLPKFTKNTSLNMSAFNVYDSIAPIKYLVRDYNTNETALKIVLTYPTSINYMKVTIDVEDAAFELSNGVTKNMTNLKFGNHYYFFVQANYFQNISLSMNYSSTKLIDSLYIYEYQNRNTSDYLEKTTYQNVSTTTDKNELVLTSVYIVRNTHTKYVAFNIIPKENIDFVTIKIDVYNNTFYLSDNVPQKIINLEAGNSYYFLVPSIIFQDDSISLTMNYMDPMPIDHIYIYEYNCSDLDFGKTLLSKNYLKFTNQLITASKIGNTLDFSLIYKVGKLDTNYVFFEITPNYNINYLIVKINVEGGSYYIKNSFDTNIDNLKINNSYYFIIESSLFNNILINLTMNFTRDDRPFDDFYIYKYEDINNVSVCLNKTSHSFKNLIFLYSSEDK